MKIVFYKKCRKTAEFKDTPIDWENTCPGRFDEETGVSIERCKEFSKQLTAYKLTDQTLDDK